MKTKFKTAGIVALVAIVVIVILQNTESVETRILFFTITMPRALLLLTSALIGAVAGIATMRALKRNKKSSENLEPTKTK